MPLNRCSVLLLLLLLQLTAVAQRQDMADEPLTFPAKLFQKLSNKVTAKIDKLDQQLTRNTEKYLQKLARQEKKLQRKLYKTDSAAAKSLGNIDAQYAAIIQKLNNTPSTGGGRGEASGEYLPHIDSLTTSLSFLGKNAQLLSSANKYSGQLQQSLGGLQQLQGKLQYTEQVKQFIRQRKDLLRQTISKYRNLPNSITKSFQHYNKQFYYYNQQVSEYKALLNDPSKWEEKALSLLNKLPAFRDFMKQHSQLASLFALPANYGSAQSLAGLQTRAQTQALIQNQLASAGPNAQAMLQQNLQAAQAQLNTLKERLLNSPSTGGGRGEVDMPDFKPNNQKTKSFWKRLEYGTNLQTAKSSTFFPTTTDIGLSVGYKLNDKSTIGVGGSFKVGWGKDIRHIALSSQGAGIRSFLDVKLKGSFFASGGFEYNYQPLDVSFSPSPGGGRGEAWQQSGLVGISKIVSLKSKLFKKTKLQLMWDFLSYQQVPRGQAIKFRVGYNL
jgi:hypothetical protein